MDQEFKPKKKLSRVLAITLTIFFATIFIFLIYAWQSPMYFRQKVSLMLLAERVFPKFQQSESEKPTGWLTLTDKEFGYEMSYPSYWVLEEHSISKCQGRCNIFTNGDLEIAVSRDYNKSSDFEKLCPPEANSSKELPYIYCYLTDKPKSIKEPMIRELYNFELIKKYGNEGPSSMFSETDKLNQPTTAAVHYIYKDGYVYYFQLAMKPSGNYSEAVAWLDKFLATFKFTK